MKSLILALVTLSSSIAFADIPPQPGTVETQEISDGAASILSDFLPTEGDFPKELGTITTEAIGERASRVYTKGKIGTKSDGSSTVSIGCVNYYYHGHQSQCKLVRIYK